MPLLRANVRRASDEDVEVIAWLVLSKHNLAFGQFDLHSDRRDSGKLSLGAGFEQRNARDEPDLLVTANDHGPSLNRFVSFCTRPFVHGTMVTTSGCLDCVEVPLAGHPVQFVRAAILECDASV